jgi:prevent-host-death family protein
MVETTISAFDARRKFGKVLDRVAAGGENVVVERHGEPVAVVIPVEAYRQWQSQRDASRARLFETFRDASERANMSPEEADALALEMVAEVRAARRARQSEHAVDAETHA